MPTTEAPPMSPAALAKPSVVLTCGFDNSARKWRHNSATASRGFLATPTQPDAATTSLNSATSRMSSIREASALSTGVARSACGISIGSYVAITPISSARRYRASPRNEAVLIIGTNSRMMLILEDTIPALCECARATWYKKPSAKLTNAFSGHFIAWATNGSKNDRTCCNTDPFVSTIRTIDRRWAGMVSIPADTSASVSGSGAGTMRVSAPRQTNTVVAASSTEARTDAPCPSTPHASSCSSSTGKDIVVRPNARRSPAATGGKGRRASRRKHRRQQPLGSNVVAECLDLRAAGDCPVRC